MTRRPGVRLELKGPVAALHFRAAPDAEADCLAAARSAAATSPDLVMQAGKMVVEVKPSRAHKGLTLEKLCRQHADFERAVWTCNPKRIANWSTQLFGDQARASCWVAVYQGELCGYVTCSREYSTWRATECVHMDCLFVVDSMRRRGLGVKLVDRVFEFATENKVNVIEWQSPAWNEPLLFILGPTF